MFIDFLHLLITKSWLSKKNTHIVSFNFLCLNSLSPEGFNLFLYKTVTDRTDSKICSAFMTSPMMCTRHKQNIRLSSNTQHAVHQPGQFLVFLHHCFQIFNIQINAFTTSIITNEDSQNEIESFIIVSCKITLYLNKQRVSLDFFWDYLINIAVS
jgi:hypothetical protein